MGKPYRECPYCGAHLDAGEICDCRAERDSRAVTERKPPAPVGLLIYKGVTPCASACMMQNRNI